MEVHTFRAATLQEALELVRKNLGPDASVLKTRETTSNRLGLFTKRFIEVEAHSDFQPRSIPKSHGSKLSYASHSSTELQQPGSISKLETAPNPLEAGEQGTSESSTTHVVGNSLAASAADLATKSEGLGQTGQNATQSDAFANPKNKATVQASQPNSSTASASLLGESASVTENARKDSSTSTTVRLKDESSAVILQLFSELTEAGLDQRTAKEIIRAACDSFSDKIPNDHLTLHGRIAKQVAESLKIGGSIEVTRDEQRIAAFVGPTGAGKTTCIGKIASSFRFDLGLQVGLITLDTFRNGGVDQLLQYAELVAAPLEVVSSPDQVIGAMQRLRECDLVLLDTTGRSPRDTEQMALLGEFLTAAEPDAIQLVLSATSSPDHAADAIEHFSLLQPTNLILTKLDEAVAFGAWLPLLQSTEMPISYLTAGQNVPRDLLVASARRLAQLILHPGQWFDSSAHSTSRESHSYGHETVN